MARKTDGEKIDELEKLAAILSERVATMRSETAGIPELTTTIALLKHQIEEIKSGRERWLQRIWMILAPLAGAVMGSLLTHYFRANP